MKKFDPFKWSEIEMGKPFGVTAGRVTARTSEISSLFVMSEGYEALASVGTDHDVNVYGPFTARLHSSVKGCVGFIHGDPVLSYRSQGEVYSNADRMPHESGTMAEITKALRMFKLEQSHLRRAISEERRSLEKTRATLKPKVDVEVVEKPKEEADTTKSEIKDPTPPKEPKGAEKG